MLRAIGKVRITKIQGHVTRPATGLVLDDFGPLRLGGLQRGSTRDLTVSEPHNGSSAPARYYYYEVQHQIRSEEQADCNAAHNLCGRLSLGPVYESFQRGQQ
ncbi:hypothetical protein G6O67_005521 [Ophiocordyceps sinensis]|uniref:Uncharacterized protein n=1 Tax=Ophiocordyceps sinensis TaxID=72228 RepID=A0A8H4PRS4_9HYPO|nr:hypothetical protein G6O67_005521 [Ophiocordyceps sinensis]